MFVLDLSFSMDSDNRLKTCKTSLCSILKNNLEPTDRAGLITFANDVQTEFNLTHVGAPNGAALNRMLAVVQKMRTRGMTVPASGGSSPARLPAAAELVRCWC